jgi:FAD:protein FMN transferase
VSAAVTVRTEVAMATLVTVRTVRSGADEAIGRAFGWFDQVEQCCSRFDSQSELAQLTRQPGVAVAVSALLFEAVRFALTAAKASGGAFDPTIGQSMEARGFNREHRTGAVVHTAVDAGPASYRDVELDDSARTITLRRPLLLDLGAVAKGLAIDLAARELQPFEDFLIDAGGDLFLGGRNPKGDPWSVGIRHPRAGGRMIETLRVTGRAVCTSGDYERRAPAGGHHILDPSRGESAELSASVTVLASSAMLADALSTAAFVLGPAAGIALLEEHGVDGVIVSPELEIHKTRGLRLAA